MNLPSFRLTRRPALALGLAAVFGSALAGSAHADTQPARVIVKWSADSAKTAQSADRVRALSERIGLAVRSGRAVANDVEVVIADGVSSEQLAARLAALPDVSYASPDRLRQARQLPNDPLYGEQWHLQDQLPAAINAVDAWKITTGSSDVIVAVVDTGIRPEHQDLAAHLLPGYDFVSETLYSGDGDGRDADPTDPGSFVTAADAAAHPGTFTGCSSTSDWHGTRVAGVISANTNNSVGVAGVSWHARILPVRALGKCSTGFDSDLIAGVRWAAGLEVPGVPLNPNPARIVNLSLGGPGACEAAYVDAINELTAKGVLLVAAAGNSTGAVETPGRCPNVLAVAGLRHIGTKVGYSSMGPEVGVAAPAGNCPEGTSSCQYQIPTTTNLGQTEATGDGYSTPANPTIGTSFSAPIVSGTAALMLSAHPGLDWWRLRNRIADSARAFTTEPTLPACPTLASDGSGQCNCNTQYCGAGMLDAGAAVEAALRPAARIRAGTGSPLALYADGSTAAQGRNIEKWSWSILSGANDGNLTGANTAQASLYGTAGNYAIRLTVTDSQGATDSVDLNVNLNSTTEPGNGGSNGGGSSKGGGGGPFEPLSLLGLAAMMLAPYLTRRRGQASATTTPTT